MSDEFTYTPPNETRYLKAVLAMLKKKGYSRIFDYLQTAKCSINPSGTYSRNRPNAVYTTVTLRMPIDTYESWNIENEENSDKKTLLDICNRIMPLESGLDVTDVDIEPILDASGNNTTPEDNLIDSTQVSTNFVLPSDIVENTHQMAKTYLHINMAVNYIRLFIEKVSIQKYGSNYYNRLNTTEFLKKVITKRKLQENQNEWKRVSVNSDLFYLGLKELAVLIQSNWDLFNTYFPDQMWIISRIDKLENYRKLISHNSFLNDKEREEISVLFRSLVKQIRCLF